MPTSGQVKVLLILLDLAKSIIFLKISLFKTSQEYQAKRASLNISVGCISSIAREGALTLHISIVYHEILWPHIAEKKKSWV